MTALKTQAITEFAERAAAVMGDAKRAGVSEGVIFSAFVAGVAGKNPMLARLMLAAVENGIAQKQFAVDCVAVDNGATVQ